MINDIPYIITVTITLITEHFLENPSLFSLMDPMAKKVATGRSHNPGKSTTIFVNFLLNPVVIKINTNDNMMFGMNSNIKILKSVQTAHDDY